MKRLQSVENALIEINEAVFQELCDTFLALRDKNYIAFSRVGSQSGKQKSIKGTPDAFKLLPNGKYIFVEGYLKTRSWENENGQKTYRTEVNVDTNLQQTFQIKTSWKMI